MTSKLYDLNFYLRKTVLSLFLPSFFLLILILYAPFISYLFLLYFLLYSVSFRLFLLSLILHLSIFLFCLSFRCYYIPSSLFLPVPCIAVCLTSSSYFGHHCGAGLAKQSRGLHMGIIQAIARLEGQTAEVFACV